MEVRLRTFWVGVAGFFGAISRYALGGALARVNRSAFPLETFVINITGSFVLGLLFALMTERFTASPTLRVALTVGFVGAYTTFSTFTYETMKLIQDGAIGFAALNVLGSVAVGLGAVYLGTWVGRTL